MCSVARGASVKSSPGTVLKTTHFGTYQMVPTTVAVGGGGSRSRGVVVAWGGRRSRCVVSARVGRFLLRPLGGRLSGCGTCRVGWCFLRAVVVASFVALFTRVVGVATAQTQGVVAEDDAVCWLAGYRDG